MCAFLDIECDAWLENRNEPNTRKNGRIRSKINASSFLDYAHYSVLFPELN